MQRDISEWTSLPLALVTFPIVQVKANSEKQGDFLKVKPQTFLESWLSGLDFNQQAVIYMDRLAGLSVECSGRQE